ncbi:MAG: EAL domain-containing protein [Gammaproteobacteria bacterium]|nr:MAG: EAL domain-containing protein [Gammaproteobacteria bacterium]
MYERPPDKGAAAHLAVTPLRSLAAQLPLFVLPALLVLCAWLVLQPAPREQLAPWLPALLLPWLRRQRPQALWISICVYTLGTAVILFVQHWQGSLIHNITRLSILIAGLAAQPLFVLLLSRQPDFLKPISNQYGLGLLMTIMAATLVATGLQPDLSPSSDQVVGWIASMGLPFLAGFQLATPHRTPARHTVVALVLWALAMILTTLPAALHETQTSYLAAAVMMGSILYAPLELARKLCALTAIATAWLLAPDLTPPYAASVHVWFEPFMFLAISIYILHVRKERAQAFARLEDEVSARTEQLHSINQALHDEIRQSRMAEQRYQGAYRKLKALLDASPVPILVLSANLRLQQANQTAEKMLFHGHMPDSMQALLSDEDAATLSSHARAILEGRARQRCIDLTMEGREGIRHIRWTLADYPGQDSDRSLILVGNDLTEMRSNEERLFYLAHFDPLTETANRRLLEERCNQTLKHIQRSGGRMALINLDLDHFKRINDTLGHDAGDALLRVIAERLKRCLREEDTVCRLGGDEFVLLLNQVDGPKGARKVARHVLDAILEPVRLENQTLTISGSIGVAIAPQDGMTYSGLLKCADMAMYAAKKAGRNRIALYAPHMNDSLQAQLRLESALSEAVRHEGFTLLYHPVIDTETRRIVAFEALLRWRHPDGHLVPPRDFLDTADNMGLLPRIADWALINVCLQARMISHVAGQPIRVSMNVSTRQLADGRIVESLRRALTETHADPRLIAIELKESILASQKEKVSETLAAIHDQGVDLILDSFGDGLSNLADLVQLPLTAVKVGRRLVQRVPGDSTAETLIDTLIGIAGHTGLILMAEGIERKEQAMFFRQRKVKLLQGYLYSRPIAQDDIAGYIRENASGELPSESQYDLPLRTTP